MVPGIVYKIFIKQRIPCKSEFKLLARRLSSILKAKLYFFDWRLQFACLVCKSVTIFFRILYLRFIFEKCLKVALS